jgi:hypothetical protein
MPCSPLCSGVVIGEGVAAIAAVGSDGSGLLLMGVLSRAPRAPRGPPTAGLCPSVCDDSLFFSAAGFSAFGRVS